MTSSVPRLGFLGAGWIGRARMNSVISSGAATAAVVADPVVEVAQTAAEEAGAGAVCATLEELLEYDLDGVVIATPTALHAQQTAAALERGLPVFCQKPLGRDAKEVEDLISSARRQDVLLGIDMSYRHLAAVEAACEQIANAEVESIYAADLVFHNAYGPDKEWARDITRAGGGALIDLGIHMLDLATMFLGSLDTERVSSALFRQGVRLPNDPHEVEDHAVAHVDLAGGRHLSLACSWWLPAGQDAVISATFYGSGGRAVAVRNVDGSFYDFEAVLIEGRVEKVLVSPPDAWGGRALIAWARRIVRDPSYDAAIEDHLAVARLIDRIYGRSS